MSESKLPSGLDPAVLEKGRLIVVEANATTLEGMLKEGTVISPAGVTWTLRCDEGKQVGGNASAPAPLDYFTLGIAF
ncbi:MAG: hypothetical protein ACE5JS_16045 [Nitrospinota bacterium]